MCDAENKILNNNNNNKNIMKLRTDTNYRVLEYLYPVIIIITNKVMFIMNKIYQNIH
jgi:hypothetical protein